MKQIPLFENKEKRFFGGILLKGKRKSRRPLCNKSAIHLVVRSEKATGRASFSRYKPQISACLKKHARKFGVKIYRDAIQSNHIHLVLRITNRKLYGYFIAATTGTIARIVTRGAGLKKQNRTFWEARPFTRILYWGKDYKQSMGYLLQNVLEALGFVPYKPRKDYYSKQI